MIYALVGQAVLGWLVADLLSGAFHWWQDNLLSEDTPVLGPYLAYHAHLHHRDPLAFTENSFLYRNGPTFALAAIVGLALFFNAGASCFLAFLVAGIAVSTQVHYWAHRPRNAPTIVRLLQETGLIQSPKQHSRHHAPPFRRAPCILTNWLNPFMGAGR
jgi:ubiquitin-conjugating enzyme E2 variant